MLVDKEQTESETILESPRVLEMVPMDREQTRGSSPLAVEGHGIEFDYGSKKQGTVLNGVDINVEKGVIYGLLGPSGCGKTTLLRCILGRLTPKSGVLRVYGRCPGEQGFCIPGRAVGYMPQELALYPDITVEETLIYFGSLYLMNYKRLLDRISFLLEFLELPFKSAFIRNLRFLRSSFWTVVTDHHPARDPHGGQKRRVSFAAAFIHEPPLLILDEPTVGVDPLLRHSIWHHLKEMTVSHNMTIIITTHYVEEARQANMVGLMRDGHLLAEMNPELLIQRHGVQNLEDVFFKLCRKETSLLQQSGSQVTTSTDGSCDLSQANGRVWLTHEEMSRVQVEVQTSNCKEEYINPALSLLHRENDPDLKRIFHKPSFYRRIRESQLRMATLIAKSFICLKRNTPFALFQIFIPAVQVIVFCLTIGQEPFDLPLAIVNDEAGKTYGYSRMFLNTISNHTFRKEIYTNLSLAIEAVETRKAWGAMHIGPRFSSSLTDRLLEGNNVENQTIEESIIKLYLDTTNQQIAITIYTNILLTFQTFAKKMLRASYQNPRLSDSPIMLATPIHGSAEPNFTEFMAPGIVLAITYVLSVGLTALSVIMERKEGLLDRCWVAGVGAGEVIFSILFTLFITMFLQIALVLVFTFFVFNMPVYGPVFWVVICVMLAGTSGMGYGLFISSICKEEVVAMLLAVGSFFPCLLLSGILWPIEGMQYYLRYFSYCLPLTILSDTMRSVMSRGWGVTEQYTWVGLVIPLAWTSGLIVVSTIIIKYSKSK